MLALLKSATKTALSLIGEGCLLRGLPCNVRIMHGVETYGTDDNVVYTRSVAIIDVDMNPKRDDELISPTEGTWILEHTHKEDGMKKQIVIRKKAV